MFIRVDYQEIADNEIKKVEGNAISRCALVDECRKHGHITGF